MSSSYWIEEACYLEREGRGDDPFVCQECDADLNTDSYICTTCAAELECGLTRIDGVLHCSLAGTEQCDFECPNRESLSQPPPQR